MSHEERNAEALARWLEANPGQEPPEDIDADVIEAMYALRPELVPAARVTVDEILAGVRSGPLAPEGAVLEEAQPGQGAEVVPFPGGAAGGQAQVASEPVAAEEAQGGQRGNLWWIGGGVATMLAAAVVLVVLVPALNVSSMAPQIDGEQDYGEIVAEAPAPPPAESVPFESTAEADAAAPSLAIAKGAGQPAQQRPGARESSSDMPMADSIIADPGDAIGGDAVADLDGLDDDELSIVRGAAGAGGESALLEDVEAPVVAARAPAPMASTRSTNSVRADEPKTATGSTSSTSYRPDGNSAKPSPWPTSESAAGKLLATSRAHLDGKRYAEAEAAAQSGLKLERGDTAIRAGLLWVAGQAREAQGQEAAARRAYREAAEINSSL